MPMVFIRHVGANLAYIEPVGAVDPGFGHGPGMGTDPDYGHPIFGHPGNRPPGSAGGRPDNSLPGMPGDTLPVDPPTAIHPGEVLILMRDPEGVWHYAALAPSSPPPRPVPPGPPDHISNRPPGTPLPPHVGGGPVQPLPPHPSGQPLPLPPQPTPQRR